MKRYRTIIFLAPAAALLLAGPARAQAPGVGYLFPPGAKIGTSAKVTVGGGNLQGATAVLLSGEGVEAKIADASKGDALALDLSVAPDAAPGLRELRVVTPRGTSNAGRLWIGSYPEANETEPNNSVASPQKLEGLPLTVNGQVNGAEDADYFAFQAGAGETYVFDLVAFRMASGLDGYLALTDARGKVLESTQEAFDRDPRILHSFQSAGTYVLQVRDSMYRGGANFVYRLTLGKLPVVTGYLPVGGRRGQTVSVHLEGANLGGMTGLTLQMPADRDRLTLFPQTPQGPAINEISLVASDLSDVVEAEPNNAAAAATPVGDLPVALNGRIDQPGDVDLFRIRPSAAGNFTFEVYGRRLGSRIDSVLRVLDATGKALQENDDAAGKDSRITFGVQAGTEYLVEVKSLDQRAGGDIFYRVEIRAPAGPDFSLSVTPDSVNVGQSGSTVITASVTRVGGFGGPIQLRLEGLPPGVTPSAAFIPAGANSAQFTVTAAPDAAPGALGMLRVIGSAEINGQQVERAAVGTESYVPPLSPPEQARQRPTRILTSTVAPQPAYTLDLSQKAVTVKRGQSVEIKITAKRQMGQDAQIAITVAGQPANVTPEAKPVPEKQTEVVLTIKVAANAPTVTQNLIITGNLNNNVQAAPALTLTITE